MKISLTERQYNALLEQKARCDRAQHEYELAQLAAKSAAAVYAAAIEGMQAAASVLATEDGEFSTFLLQKRDGEYSLNLAEVAKPANPAAHEGAPLKE